MRKLFVLCKRNFKEIVREPISLIFCFGFPIVMLVLLQALFANLPFTPENFRIERYAVGICIFGYAFISLFTAMLFSGDKNSEFINRLHMAPISKTTFLLSYVLSMLPIALVQTLLFFACALIFKLPFSVNILLAVLYLFPSALFYISLGVLCGVLAKNEKQAGPIGSIIISCSTMLGGVFMPIEGMGAFSTAMQLLPFAHTVDIAAGVFSGNLLCFFSHVLWVVGYLLLIWALILLFFKQKK